MWQLCSPSQNCFSGEAFASLLSISSTYLYFFHSSHCQGIGRKHGGRREPRTVILCYRVIVRHQKWDSGCIRLKRKARKHRSHSPMSEVMCVNGMPIVCVIHSEKAMLSSQERGPCQQPHSEVPWDEHGGELGMAGRREFS